jgi:hypothetical protein
MTHLWHLEDDHDITRSIFHSAFVFGFFPWAFQAPIINPIPQANLASIIPALSHWQGDWTSLCQKAFHVYPFSDLQLRDISRLTHPLTFDDRSELLQANQTSKKLLCSRVSGHFESLRQSQWSRHSSAHSQEPWIDRLALRSLTVNLNGFHSL